MVKPFLLATVAESVCSATVVTIPGQTLTETYRALLHKTRTEYRMIYETKLVIFTRNFYPNVYERMLCVRQAIV